MKKNSTRYLLGAALVGVWGLLGFKVYNKLKQQQDQPFIARSEEFQPPPQAPRSYTLSLDYEDPFNGKDLPKAKAKSVSIQQKPIRVNKKRPTIATKKQQEKKIVFPNIAYRGNIKTEGREVALVNINGEFVHLESGQDFQKINLVKVFDDSIKVAYAGEQKIIRKLR